MPRVVNGSRAALADSFLLKLPVREYATPTGQEVLHAKRSITSATTNYRSSIL
jgi:hypothetical protein